MNHLVESSATLSDADAAGSSEAGDSSIGDVSGIGAPKKTTCEGQGLLLAFGNACAKFRFESRSRAASGQVVIVDLRVLLVRVCASGDSIRLVP
mmetsp:Transcript_2545/g.7564  ORF Transcript_2545/g.7564 Transcript_2545/m.7564 type:complete len:94 (+) Transcript_2545:2092-2373(+)